MRPSPIKAVILDVDGVLTGTAELHAAAWKQMFDEYVFSRTERDSQPIHPFDVDADYLRYVDGKPRYEGVQSFLRSRDIDLPWGDESDPPSAETVCGLGNRKNERFLELLGRHGPSLFDDAAAQILRWRRRGLPLAAVTSSRNGRRILRGAELDDRFDVVLDGVDAAELELAGKPAADLFLAAAQRLGVEPGEAAVVEDAIAGVSAGRAGNFRLVVGVARDGDAESLRGAGADQVVSRLTDIELADQHNRRDTTGKDMSPDETSTKQTPRNDPRHRTAGPAAGPSVGANDLLSNEDDRRQLEAELESKRLALFLDYDGTLTPIVRRPGLATLSDSIRTAIRRVADRAAVVAIISGRDTADVSKMVGIEELVYGGSHGFDISGPDGFSMQFEPARDRLPQLDAAESTLRERLDPIAGCHIERKKFAIAVHYREVAEDDVPRIERCVAEVAREQPGLRKRGGKKIFELQPDVQWDKGRAVLWLLERLRLDQPDVLPIYIGDDETDEDAFAALEDRGVGIRVGEGSAATGARYRLADTESVGRLLRWMSERLSESEAPHG